MQKKISSESESQHCHLLEVVICVITVGQSVCRLLCRQTQNTWLRPAFGESCLLLRVNQAKELATVRV